MYTYSKLGSHKSEIAELQYDTNYPVTQHFKKEEQKVLKKYGKGFSYSKWSAFVYFILIAIASSVVMSTFYHISKECDVRRKGVFRLGILICVAISLIWSFIFAMRNTCKTQQLMYKDKEGVLYDKLPLTYSIPDENQAKSQQYVTTWAEQLGNVTIDEISKQIKKWNTISWVMLGLIGFIWVAYGAFIGIQIIIRKYKEKYLDNTVIPSNSLSSMLPRQTPKC